MRILAATWLFYVAQEKPITASTSSTLIITTALTTESREVTLAAKPAHPFVATRIPPNLRICFASFE
jgi:hypothetical protein